LRSAFDEESRRTLQATGGDDYELCFTAPEAMRLQVQRVAREAGIEVARIGRVVEDEGVVALDAGGKQWLPPRRGYAHFND
jgi:thiamine-monophosphate kinase